MAGFYLLLTYLLASIPTGLVLTTLYTDVDIRETGSGNIGATNVARVAGKKLGLATLAGDLLKGALPVMLAGTVDPRPVFAGLVGLTAFIGHCWSGYLGFRGGKGVATSAGVLLALAPLPSTYAIALWVSVAALTRKSSLAALTAATSLPLLILWFTPEHTWVALLICLGVVVRHKDNIQRLRAGTER